MTGKSRSSGLELPTFVVDMLENSRLPRESKGSSLDTTTPPGDGRLDIRRFIRFAEFEC